MECKRCNGVGYIETSKGNQTCTCMIAESIKEVLKIQPQVLLAKNLKIQRELFNENQVISSKSKGKVFSILKTMFTYMFLKGKVKSIDIIDSDTLMEAYFQSSTYYTMSSVKEEEFLVILIEDGKTNKILPDVIKSIVTYRKNILNKPTWIWLNSVDENEIKSMHKFTELVQFLNEEKFDFKRVK